MLTFWSPECFACREELPTLQAIATDPASDVVLLTVVSHLPAEDVRKFMRDQGLTFRVIVDEKATIPARYQVTGIPFTYFIRPEGTVDRAVIGAGEEGELHTKLQGWLKTCNIDAPCKVQK
jgi:thiol-disulfide isomerase/thioredoxin